MKNTMKKFISNLIFATFVALGLASCSKTDKNLEKLSGEWYWQGTEAGVELEKGQHAPIPPLPNTFP